VLGKNDEIVKIENGVLYVKKAIDSKFLICTDEYNYIVKLNFKELEFNPKKEELCYYPSIITTQGYESVYWSNIDSNNNVKKRVGLYRTKEQAIEKAKELGWID